MLVKGKRLIILIIILVLIVTAIGGGVVYYFWLKPIKDSTTTPIQKSSKKVQESSQEQETTIKFQQLRKIDLGEGIYSNIVFTNDHFYVSYQLKDQGLFVNIYDQDFNFQEKKQLIDRAGSDHQFFYNKGNFYLVTALYLKKFDLAFEEKKSIDYFAQLPAWLQKKWSHGVDDMLLAAGQDSIYLGSASGNVTKDEKNQKIDQADDLYLQKYDLDLRLKSEWLLKDLGNTPGSSLIENDSGFSIITSDKHWDDSGLIAATYDNDGNELSKKTISAVANVNEEFAMGSLRQNDTYFVVYQYISGDLAQPTVGEPLRRVDVMLKAFDGEWNLLGQTIVTEDLSDTDLGSHLRAPHLVLANDKLYVTYSTEAGTPKIWIKEYEIK